MKGKERLQAIELRKSQGLSIGKIADSVGVSKSSVSLWVRDIQLTDEQIRKLSKCSLSREKARSTRIATSKAERIKLQDKGRRLAKKYNSDKDFIAGCVMYWAEGAKCERGAASMTNSDPNILKLFVNFLITFFDVDKENFSMFCRYYTDLASAGEPEAYWLKQLEMPNDVLRKSCVNYYPKSKRMVKRKYKHGKLKYGVCRLKINSVEVMQKIYGAIQELMGFEEPKWSNF